MPPITLYFRLSTLSDSERFARAIGEHLLAGMSNPSVVVASGGVDAGKTLLCRNAFAPLIGEKKAARLAPSGLTPQEEIEGTRKIRHKGKIYRRADFGRSLTHRPDQVEWVNFLSGTGGMMPRAPQGYGGADWVERPTLQHIVRADYVLTIAAYHKDGLTPSLSNDLQIANGLTETIERLPKEVKLPVAGARRFRFPWQSDPRLEQAVGWDEAKAAYVTDVVIPQILKTAELAQTFSTVAEQTNARIAGLTINSPALSDEAVRNFERKTQALRFIPG